MANGPRVIIIGAGIVGCAVADELTARGWTNVTVLEQGPLFATGGSSSHAPGLVFQVNSAQTMTRFAQYTVRKYSGLTLDGQWCFKQLGGLEVATTPERWQDLKRKQGWATSWGVPAFLLSPDEAAALHPLLDRGRILGALHIPSDGLAKPLRAAEAQARRASERGARFLAGHTVLDVTTTAGQVNGVRTDHGDFPADIAVCCAGMWGPRVAALAGLDLPLLPMAHQYAKTTPLPALAGLHAAGAAGQEASHPILRHQDRDLYFREHGDRLGIGSYQHRPMPKALEEIRRYEPGQLMPSIEPFTADDFAAAWRDSRELLPALAEVKVDDAFNGLFSFTADGFPLLGESPRLRGFWVAEAVWITHSAGVAASMAEWLVDGRPAWDLHECDVNRFDSVQLTPDYVQRRACRSFIEVYDIAHPLQPSEDPGPLRTSPFASRQRDLGAEFLTTADGWQRPHWYEANAILGDRYQVPGRDGWAARYWSPVAGLEARATRDRVALYDMTPLRRLEVTGPGALAFLQRMTTNQLDRPVGTVCYTLLLDRSGGIRSDLTVARLSGDEFQVGANSALDLDWLTRHLPGDGSVMVRDLTAGTCCVGVWGPLARDLVQPLSSDDFSHRAFGYFRAMRTHVGCVPVTALRVSYVGELGWELYTTADLGLALWDTLWDAGQRLGVIAAGRAALDSLRLEKNYRSAGRDMTTEHNPYEAGLSFAVRMDKGDFVGRDSLAEAGAAEPSRRLACLAFDDPGSVVMGSEPVFAGPRGTGRQGAGRALGYVTSAGFGFTIGQPLAYAWLPADAAVTGTRVEAEYFGDRYPAVVTSGAVVDPEMRRLRC
jgi:glycine cleavage system aminomethyltransferase T/glycine/D-amino acid oxidase-like deaminating enzyme